MTPENLDDNSSKPKIGFPGTWIPSEVGLNSNLTYTEKYLFGIINNLTHNDCGYCFATNSYLATIMDVSENRISICISNLIKHGYITSELENYVTKNVHETVNYGTRRRIYIDNNYLEKYKYLTIEYVFEQRRKKIGNTNKDYNPPETQENNGGGYQKRKPPLFVNENPPFSQTKSICTIVSNNNSSNYKGSNHNHANAVQLTENNQCEKDLNQKVFGVPTEHCSDAYASPLFKRLSKINLPLPKQSPPKKPDTPVEGNLLRSIIREWNDFPDCGQSHHSLEKTTGLIKNTSKLIDALRNGVFFRNVKLDYKKFTRHKDTLIEWEKNHRKFTPNEILAAIRQVRLFYTEGYWPQNKNTLPKNLENLIYNPRTQNSFFVQALLEPPHDLKKTYAPKQNNPELTKEVTGMLRELFKIEPEENELPKVITFCNYVDDVYKSFRAVKFRDDTPFSIDLLFRRHFCPSDFIEHYFNWVDKQRDEWLEDVDLNICNTGNGLFRKFIRDVINPDVEADVYDFKFDPQFIKI